MKVTVTLLNPILSAPTQREFETYERAEQWCRQCGVFDPFKVEITNGSGQVLYGFVSHEYGG
jgi:hypothetical protein